MIMFKAYTVKLCLFYYFQYLIQITNDERWIFGNSNLIITELKGIYLLEELASPNY